MCDLWLQGKTQVELFIRSRDALRQLKGSFILFFLEAGLSRAWAGDSWEGWCWLK